MPGIWFIVLYTYGWGESLAADGLGVVRSEQYNAGGSGALVVVLDRWWQRFSCCLGLVLGPKPNLVHLLACFLFSCTSLFCFFVVHGLLAVNKSQPFLVRLGDPGLRTLDALSGLVRQWFVGNWTLPPSGRMKHRATGSSGWLHSGKAELISNLWLSVGLFFPVCRLYCKAVEIASCAIPANWRMIEYKNLVENLAIIVRCSLDAYCILGFRYYVPPLYLVVSLMKA